jgi:hypothetical protein
MEGGSSALAHPEKVVKRARVEEPSGATKVTYKATRWERRRSRGVTSEFGSDSAFDVPTLITLFQEKYQSRSQN